MARLKKPFQNSEGLFPLDVEHIEVGWFKHPSISLHESGISLEDGGLLNPKSGIFTDESKTISGVGDAFCVLKDNLECQSSIPDSNFSLQQACHKFVMTRVQVCDKFVVTRVQACSKLTKAPKSP
ncbi:hypothetical protein AVEN_156890-1 [Araneus ventricosus]|uniref:Uncharacterized protein n=1 Tax=Araneus ventricosus TaxID=182803 RepID=A0A4Y2EPD6_ARAVE|nr:hypothetical protein AVEN_156890-1 [Araneus ventricosus]